MMKLISIGSSVKTRRNFHKISMQVIYGGKYLQLEEPQKSSAKTPELYKENLTDLKD